MEAMENRLILFPEGALYIGAIRDNDFHSHPAYQIVLGEEPFQLRIDSPGTGPSNTADNFPTLRTKAAIIPSQRPHSLQAGRTVWLLLLDPDSRWGPTLKEHVSREPLCHEGPVRFPDLPGADFAMVPLSTIRPAIHEILNRNFGIRSPAESSTRRRHEGISRALESLSNHPDLHVKLADIAFHAGLSESRLVHLFKEEMLLPIRRHILWLRIQRAVRAVQSGHSLTEAAHAAGFSDQAHFSRTFKQTFGISPRDGLARNTSVKLCQER